ISLRACSLSALFSSRRFCRSPVSNPSTGWPRFTSLPSGAIIDILKSETSLICGGPKLPESTAESVPVTSMPVMRSPRETRTQSPCRSAARLLRVHPAPARTATMAMPTARNDLRMSQRLPILQPALHHALLRIARAEDDVDALASGEADARLRAGEVDGRTRCQQRILLLHGVDDHARREARPHAHGIETVERHDDAERAPQR